MLAPWILEAWSDALAALRLDLPVLELTEPQRLIGVTVLLAAVALLGTVSTRGLPHRARGAVALLLTALAAVPAVLVAAPQFDNPDPPASLASPSAEKALPPADDPRWAGAREQDREDALAALANQGPVRPRPDSDSLGQPAAAKTAAAPVAAEPQRPPAPARRPVDVTDVLRTRIPVYFATDRAVEGVPARPVFLAASARRLAFGRAVVALDAGADAQMPVRTAGLEPPPAIPAPRAAHLLESAEVLSRDDLQEAAVMKLARSERDRDHALVFVHGFDTPLVNSLLRAAEIARHLKFDGAVFVYSWPAQVEARYAADRASARAAAPFLAEFLRFVLKESSARHVSVVAHAQGAEPAIEAIAQVASDLPPPGRGVRDLVLIAPDLERPTFAGRVAVLRPFVARVVLYAAENDRSLAVSRRFAGAVPRAGDLFGAGPMVLPGVETIDTAQEGTEAIATHHAIPANRTKLIDDLGAVLRSKPEASRHAGGAAVAGGEGAYWRLP